MLNTDAAPSVLDLATAADDANDALNDALASGDHAAIAAAWTRWNAAVDTFRAARRAANATR